MNEYTIFELIEGIKTKRFSSVDLVKMYSERIKKLDASGPKLNSVAIINPDALKIAKELDEEYLKKGPRSILHGIPILIKDNINTFDKMPTTASSFALKDYFPANDAFIVKKIREAGMVILGKTNLSEFAYFMSFDDMPSGYGSLNGQVKSPYSDKIDPLGSSTGSAVAVASNLIPLAIGTETNGSLTAPAQNNSIVAIKPTLGLVSRTGIIPISQFQDTAGPMARTVAEAASLLEILIGFDSSDLITKNAPKNNYKFSKTYSKDINDLTIGFLKFSNVKYDKEELEIFKRAEQLLKPLAKKTYSIELEQSPIQNFKTLIHEFKHDLNVYFKTNSKTCNISSLSDLIDFNNHNRERCLRYGQSIFLAANKTKGNLEATDYLEIKAANLKKANKLNQLMRDYKIDVLILPRRTSHAPIAGNPVVAVPAKALIDNTPRSLFFVSQNFKDELCIRVAYQYEQLTNYRIPPKL